MQCTSLGAHVIICTHTNTYDGVGERRRNQFMRPHALQLRLYELAITMSRQSLIMKGEPTNTNRNDGMLQARIA